MKQNKKGSKCYTTGNTIEEFLRTRQKSPVFTLELAKDMCRRIKRLEKKREHGRRYKVNK